MCVNLIQYNGTSTSYIIIYVCMYVYTGSEGGDVFKYAGDAMIGKRKKVDLDVLILFWRWTFHRTSTRY